MLKIRKTRETRGDFFVVIDGEEILVKSVTAHTNHEAVSTFSEQVYDTILYAKNRRAMRKDEQEFQQVVHAIEDDMAEELEVEEQ